MTETKKILLVADYGKDDLAFKEVEQRLYELAEKKHQRIQIDIISVDPFHTLQTAAVVAQAAETGLYDAIYHNTAPRRDIGKARVDNDGEGLAFARYQSDSGSVVDIVGVNAGDANSVNTFALLDKNKLLAPDGRDEEGIYKVRSTTNGSQFRSRDVFPPHVIAAVAGDIQLGDKPLTDDQVPAHVKGSPGEKRNAPKIAHAAREAKQLLAGAYDHQLSRHGDASAAYITIIGRRKHLGTLIGETAAVAGNAEIDALPLKKSDGNNWIETGFTAAQLALNSGCGEKRTILAFPYRGEFSTLKNADTLYEAKLDNGATIITSDLHSLVFAKERLSDEGVKRYGKEGRSVSLENGALHISGNGETLSAAELAGVTLPYPVTPVYNDGYGNVKLSIRHPDLLKELKIGRGPGETPLAPGDRAVVQVTANGKKADAIVANGSFAVGEGELALSRGSSGWARSAESAPGLENFAEIFLRGGSATNKLGSPHPGDRVNVSLRESNMGGPPELSWGQRACN